MLARNPIIIDIEASGFDPYSYPIEVGIILSDQQHYCSLIKPANDWQHWSYEAEQIHGLSRDILFQYGKGISVVTDELNNFLTGKTVYSDGWVVDQPWLTCLFARAGKLQRFSISPLEMILTEAQMEIWHKTKDKVIKELALKRHRASSDAMIVQQTYIRTQSLTAS